MGSLAVGGTSVVLIGSEDASAQVSVDSFSVADASFQAEAIDPVVDVTVAYDYDVGNSSVRELLLTLVVDGTDVAQSSLTTDRTTLEGEETLRGRVADSEQWSAEEFAPEVASSVERDVSVTVRFAVVGTDGETLVSDEATDTAVVSVSHPQESEYVASVGGSGEIIDGDSE